MTFSEEQYRTRAEQIEKLIPLGLAWGSSVAVLIERGSRLRVLGSGTLFRIAEDSFVVTAAHVMEQGQGSNLRIIASDGTDLIPFEGKGILDATGKTDVGVVRLLPKVAERIDSKRFLGLENASFDENVENAMFTVFGFPEIMSFHEKSNLKITKYYHMSSMFEGDTSALENYDPRLHFVIGAELSETRGTDGKLIDFCYQQGFRAEFPRELKGISGGSVWKIADSPADLQGGGGRAKIIGVETSIHQKSECIRATRWKAVVYLLAKALPELRPAIEMWRPV